MREAVGLDRLARGRRLPSGTFAVALLLAGGALAAPPPTLDWTTAFTRTWGGYETRYASCTDASGVTYLIYNENFLGPRLAVYGSAGAVTRDVSLLDAGGTIGTMAVDPSGNVIAAGTKTNTSTGRAEVFIAKYDGLGNYQWAVTYDTGYSNKVTNVTADLLGGILVVGYFNNSGDIDGFVAKHDAAGTFVWGKAIDFTTRDEAYAVTTDASGTVYVSGTYLPGATTNTFVAKYNPAGVFLTAFGYGLFAGSEYGRALVYSGSANALFVGVDNLLSMCVAKINPSSMAISGSGYRSSAVFNCVGSIAVDVSGNAFIGGWTSTDATSIFDVLCVKFNTSQVAVWSDTYDAGGQDALGYPKPRIAVGVDSLGSVYYSANITPSTCIVGAQDLFVRKYSGAGVEQWTRCQDGPSLPSVAGAATDGSGGVYISGAMDTDATLVKYNRAGAWQWTRYPTYGGLCVMGSRGIASSGGVTYLSGDLYDVGIGAGAAGVAKLDATGSQVGTCMFTGIRDLYDGPIAVDGSGNVFMAGKFYSSTTMEDELYVAKFDSSGTIVWTRTMSLAVDDLPIGVAVDGGGAVYVLHKTPNDGVSNDVTGLLKLSSAGDVQWVKTYTPSASLDCSGGDIRVAGSDVWVVSADLDPGSGAAWGRIYRMDASGNVAWTRSYNGGQDVLFSSLVIPASGNPAVTGLTGSMSKGVLDVLNVSYDPAGNERWAVSYDSGSPSDTGVGVAAGSLFVGANTGSDFLTMRYTEPLLVASLAVTPSPAQPGQWVDAVLTVTNTGGADATGVAPEIQVNSGAGNATLKTSPPVGPYTILSGASQSFTWTYSMSGGATAEFTGTASGTESAWGEPVRAAATGAVLAGLVGSLSVVPSPAVVGEWVQVVLTVTNMGGPAVTGVIPALDVNSGAGLLVSKGGPVPPGPVVLAGGGGSQTFVWTFSASGVGVVEFTATADGTDSGSKAPVEVTGHASVGISARARFEGALSLPVSPAYVGQWITVALTITNTGTLAATTIMPFLQLNGGASLVLLKNGPEPPDLLSLAGGTATTFSWTYSVSGNGTVSFTATAAGWDGASGIAFASGSGTVSVLRPAHLVAAAAVSPATAAVGQTLTITLTVTNTGQVDAANVVPMALAVGPGATIVSLATGPTPPGPVTVAAGASQVFTWTYGTSADGLVTVTGTVTGTDAALSVPVTASASRSATLVPPAAMQSILSVVPSAYQGQTVTVTMTVSNTGSTAVWFIGSSKGAGPAPAGLVSVVSGPSGPPPMDLASLAPHGSVAFSWAYLAVAAGAASFTATASGTDSVSGFPVSAQDTSGTLTILPASLLVASASVSPAQVDTGASFDVRLTVTNTGGAAVTGVLPSLALSDPALATVTTGPVPAAGGTVAAGGTTTWAWTLSAASAGTLTLTAKADGTDAGTSGAVGVSSSVAVVIAPRISGEIAVYPNPLRSGVLSIYLKLRDDAREVSVDVYDAGMHRVYDGKWRSVPRLQATLDVAGAARWAPGIYYVRAKAAFADGSSQKFPVTKLVVKP